MFLSITLIWLTTVTVFMVPQLLLFAAALLFYRYPHNKRTGCESTAPLPIRWSACHCGNPWYSGFGQFWWDYKGITRFSRPTCQVMLTKFNIKWFIKKFQWLTFMFVPCYFDLLVIYTELKRSVVTVVFQRSILFHLYFLHSVPYVLTIHSGNN